MEIKDKRYANAEEKDLIKSFNKGEWQPMPEKDKINFKSILKKAATGSIMKRKAAGEKITIIIDKDDLISIKKLASQKGLPYQTFTKSVLHQYIGGQFIDKNELKKLRDIKMLRHLTTKYLESMACKKET